MEFPSFNHHHRHINRYVPHPPNNFSDGHPNIYPNHHRFIPPHHIPPRPPLSYPNLPPPPPPPPLPVPPPPPSYNPHQSHFTFLDEQNPSFLNHSRSSPPKPRVSNQSHRFDYRTDSWSDPHRVPPELLHRNPILPDDYHRRLYSPNSQSENYYKPHGTERVITSSRFRDDTMNDGYASRDISSIVSHEQVVFRGNPNNDRFIDRYASDRSVMDMDKASGSSSINLEDFVEKYEPRYMTMSEKERIWDSEEDPKWIMKGKKNELGHNDGVSYVSGREQSRDYEYESSKFNRVREGREEFKQVQKKSVLLRIGKPNNTYKNRNHDQHSSKAYLVESNNSNFRGKDKDKDKDKDRDRDYTGKDSCINLDQRMEGDGEHSPVELDVSFKSNVLVAKAVVTPSSPVFDNNHSQPRNRKIKRVTEFDSPLSKFSERSSRSGSSSHGFDSPSSSEKAPKQLRDEDSAFDGANGSMSGPVLDENGVSGRSDRPLSFRLRKKRKFTNLGSPASTFQLTEKDGKSVKGENKKSTPTVSIRSVISFPPLEELIPSKVDKFPQAMVADKDGSEVENHSLDYINRSNDVSIENNNQTAQKVSMINDYLVNDLNQQPSENEILPNHESFTQKTSTDIKLSLGGTDISDSSMQDQIEIRKCPTESYAGFVADSLCNGSVKMQETSATHDVNSVDPCSDEIITIFPENGDVHGFLDDVSRTEEEIQLLEDGPKESPNAVVAAEDNTNLSSGKSFISDAVPDVGVIPNSSLKESSFDKDEVIEMVNLLSTAVQTPSPDHREPSMDETYLLPKDDVPHSSNIISECANGTGIFISVSNDKLGEPMSDMLTRVVYSPKDSSFSDSQILTKSADKTISNSNIPNNDDNICVKSLANDDALLNGPELFIENSRTSIKTSHLEVTKTASSASQGSCVKTLGSNTKMQGSNLPIKKPSAVSSVPRVFAGRSSQVLTKSRINNTANNITKPRTWHRSTSDPASVTKSSVPPPPKQIEMGQNSYIRSGNTLVRKNAPVNAIASVPPASRPTVYQSNPSGPIESRNNAGTGGPSAPVVRPKTPPLSGNTKLSDCTTISSRDMPSSPLEVTSPEDQNGTISNFESQKILDEGAAGKKIQYVKRKSNQLVAASNSDQSIQELDKMQQSSDGYYKRRKNQLIRTLVGDDPVNTYERKASKINIKRQSGKGISKKYKHLRFPSVWTLSSQSSGKDGVSLRQKLRPHLFPWKRSRYWENEKNISASIPSNSSSSAISRKLLLSRKRDMIYTRSKHGFSLRMSKLLSVGGSSLKWSKSIERNSKRANEEATLAVAASEKKKREQHGTACTTVDIKSRNNMSRDRIFRIGLVRYKMDPSRKTLQRMSDDEPSSSMQSKEDIKSSYVPKRLKIGHDEYVRIGNGNQLVRNPKKRTRIFANEKVRWSLHTARSRLARKKKYCQFFTRFGKCNKGDGKCQYIHDSSKIAVCTKFLNGSCSNPNCKLTHKVIPERMQDCSYFMQGLCSNKHCPYRHVNVNSTASICEGFLKGYCADGNECRKKHTYACPVFEATGTCSQGTKCKLHHPKNRNNTGLKRKRQHSMEQHHQKNSRGRYFGFIKGGEAMPISESHHLKEDDDVDILCQQGKFAEYISLDFSSYEEDGEAISEQRTTFVSEPSDLGAPDFDDLTKPIKIMEKVVLDNPNVCESGVS